MKIKRILAALLCVAMLAQGVFANESGESGKDISEQVQETESTSKKPSVSTQQADNDSTDTPNDGTASSNTSDMSEPSSDISDSDTPNNGEAAEDDNLAPGEQITPDSPGFLRPNEYYSVLFNQILDLYVEKHLYESTEQEVLLKMVDNMINSNPYLFKYIVNSMLSTLDPYSSYHEADSGFLSVENASTGYGITVENSLKGTKILKVVPGSAADAAGLKAGDEIISLCGYSVENLPKNAVMLILTDPYIFAYDKDESGKYPDKNPMCEFVVERNGVTHTISLKKASLTVSQVSGQILEDGITAYVVVSSFLGENTDVEFNNLITAYAQNGIKNLTIDLRNNGGGSLQYALEMAETFVDNGSLLCYYNERGLQEPTPIYSTTDKVSFDSVTILVNGQTASASELFTRILQTKGVAKIIGESTVGKTMGQLVYTLPNNDFITITTYEMLDENLETYGQMGIEPDLEIQNVKLLYQLPELNVFNHQNYVEITRDGYSDVTKGLEDRLVVMGLMFPEDADGYFDDTTSAALKIYQRNSGITATGECTYDTVTKITDTINAYKYYTYYEDSQYDVAMIVHSSFSQGKRLVKEKEKLAEENAELIAAEEAEIEAELDKLEQEAQQQG